VQQESSSQSGLIEIKLTLSPIDKLRIANINKVCKVTNAKFCQLFGLGGKDKKIKNLDYVKFITNDHDFEFVGKADFLINHGELTRRNVKYILRNFLVIMNQKDYNELSYLLGRYSSKFMIEK